MGYGKVGGVTRVIIEERQIFRVEKNGFRFD